MAIPGASQPTRLYPAGVEDGTLEEAVELVERFLRSVAIQDWKAVNGCISPDVVRRGPFGDDVDGRAPYVDLLGRTMPALPGYRMDLDRVTGAGGHGNHLVFAELRETLVVDGAPVVTEECLVFEVEGVITTVSIYIRRTG